MQRITRNIIKKKYIKKNVKKITKTSVIWTQKLRIKLQVKGKKTFLIFTSYGYFNSL